MKPELLVDGLNVFMRHFAANPSRSLNGNLCGGVLGFLKNIQHLVDKFSPSKITVVWEGGGSSRRRSIDKNYKNGRRPVKLNRYYSQEEIPDTSENRDNQLKILIELLGMIPVTQIYLSDIEADDVIGYISRYRNDHRHKIIVSSDKDYYQLIDENTKVWSPNQKKIIDEDTVLEKFGISPQNFCLTRCFSGDASDGIKGVRGAGFKVMSKRFPVLATCNDVFIDDIIKESKQQIQNKSKLKIYQEIIDSEFEIKKNWKLMYLDVVSIGADKIKSINYQYEKKEKLENKFAIMKVLLREGLSQFDVHTFYLSIKSLSRSLNER